MHRKLAFLLAFAALGAAFAGCSRSSPAPDEQGREAGAEAEWSWIRGTKRELDARRRELARLEAAQPRNAPAPAALTALREEVRGLSEELNRRLVDFLNARPPVAGEPLAGRTLEAVRMKSDEDVRLAREHIEKGGDYQRAVEIYEAALAVDPDNPRLRQELASAQARRYMTAERFAQVREGMTQDEVRSLLGQPNLNNVREYPERGITAWFYTKDSQGAAAAVWFQRQAKGSLVYQADFDALGPGPSGGETTPPASPSAASGP